MHAPGTSGAHIYKPHESGYWLSTSRGNVYIEER